MKTKTDYFLSRCMTSWNWHTSPSALRSDFEHTIHRKAAKKIMRLIQSRYLYGRDYVESNYTGRLIFPS